MLLWFIKAIVASAYSTTTSMKDVKWTRAVKNDLRKGKRYSFSNHKIIEALYRPFAKRRLYFDKALNEMQYQLDHFFQGDSSKAFVFSDAGARAPFGVLACDSPPEYHLAASSDGFQCIALNRYNDTGQRVSNITHWGRETFKKYYKAGSGNPDPKITDESIFQYVYAVLHDPIYREKYALNLKREFPRIPFYKDFWQWAEWGKELMDLHIGYESVTPAKLKRIDLPDEKARKAGLPPKCISADEAWVDSMP